MKRMNLQWLIAACWTVVVLLVEVVMFHWAENVNLGLAVFAWVFLANGVAQLPHWQRERQWIHLGDCSYLPYEFIGIGAGFAMSIPVLAVL